MTTRPAKNRTTTAFYAQAVISFGLSVAALGIGIAYLPVTTWVRSFMGLGLLYVVTSTFTLAKCVRDRNEEASVVSRVDQARLDKLLAEHDPFKND
ncbi:YiaA/YiaB family inner membrane protein [Streptosporangium sp. V21-05]|uniref:YiaA/YiaB family inner membrane protein n=1 Tax=Streptosporangium sp. V21-05 TaxID=3446115 RepID=UPI003F538F17